MVNTQAKINIGVMLHLVVISLIFVTINVSATDWYKGSLHQHTGFSTETGYDGVEGQGGDDCSELLEGLPQTIEYGKNVSNLTQSALSKGLSWLSFTDHSYCLDENEFNVVKNDCNTEDSARSNFACLSGTELSVREHSPEIEPIISTSCANVLFGEAHLGANGINSYVGQYPFGFHCPISPKAQTGINDANNILVNLTEKEGEDL